MSRVAVLYGGNSLEREVSINSGTAVLRALRNLGYDPVAVDTKVGVASWTQIEADIYFNALHGEGGEDGTIQGVLQLLGVPYTGCGVLASALSYDKHTTKCVWREAGLPTPKWFKASVKAEYDIWAEQLELLGGTAFLKLVKGGSSIGVAKLGGNAGLGKSLDRVLADFATFNNVELILEQAAVGEEYTVGVLNGEPLPIAQVISSTAFFDFEAKYQRGGSTFRLNTDLSPALQKDLQDMAVKASQALGCGVWSRLDLIVTSDGPQLLEINSVPGMTDHSSLPKMAESAALTYEDLVQKGLDMACVSEEEKYEQGGGYALTYQQ